jgi:hypothetical protein
MPELPRTIQQGNTLRIHGSASAVAARMNDRSIRLFPQGSGSLGLMPVPADQKPGEYKSICSTKASIRRVCSGCDSLQQTLSWADRD